MVAHPSDPSNAPSHTLDLAAIACPLSDWLFRKLFRLPPPAPSHPPVPAHPPSAQGGRGQGAFEGLEECATIQNDLLRSVVV